MARGTEEKATVSAKILELFDGAFEYGKEIRIPINDVQIKVTLTCAKDNVYPDSDTAIPGSPAKSAFPEAAPAPKKANKEPTEEELDNIANALAALGLN